MDFNTQEIELGYTENKGVALRYEVGGDIVYTQSENLEVLDCDNFKVSYILTTVPCIH